MGKATTIRLNDRMQENIEKIQQYTFDHDAIKLSNTATVARALETLRREIDRLEHQEEVQEQIHQLFGTDNEAGTREEKDG